MPRGIKIDTWHVDVAILTARAIFMNFNIPLK